MVYLAYNSLQQSDYYVSSNKLTIGTFGREKDDIISPLKRVNHDHLEIRPTNKSGQTQSQAKC